MVAVTAPPAWSLKGFPAGYDPESSEKSWNILDGQALFPLVTLRESALRTNTISMMQYCARNGVSLAPHGKTTMSPQLFARQMATTCWGISAATALRMVNPMLSLF